MLGTVGGGFEPVFKAIGHARPNGWVILVYFLKYSRQREKI